MPIDLLFDKILCLKCVTFHKKLQVIQKLCSSTQLFNQRSQVYNKSVLLCYGVEDTKYKVMHLVTDHKPRGPLKFKNLIMGTGAPRYWS